MLLLPTRTEKRRHTSPANHPPICPNIGNEAARRRLPRFLPRRTIHVHAGPAVDLSDLYGREVTREVANEATDRIMAAITALLEEVRGESAPAVRFDPKAHGLPAIGRYDRTAARREARR